MVVNLKTKRANGTTTRLIDEVFKYKGAILVTCNKSNRKLIIDILRQEHPEWEVMYIESKVATLDEVIKDGAMSRKKGAKFYIDEGCDCKEVLKLMALCPNRKQEIVEVVVGDYSSQFVIGGISNINITDSITGATIYSVKDPHGVSFTAPSLKATDLW